MDRPNQYCPITCPPTLYELPTGIIAESMYNHLMKNNNLMSTTKWMLCYCYDVKDQLLLNKTVSENGRRIGKNSFMAWID